MTDLSPPSSKIKSVQIIAINNHVSQSDNHRLSMNPQRSFTKYVGET